MVGWMEKKFHICAIESASRKSLADFLKNKGDAARSVLSCMSGPYSVMTMTEGGEEEIVMALPDMMILSQAELYFASLARVYSEIIISGFDAERLGEGIKSHIENSDEVSDVQVLVVTNGEFSKHTLDIACRRA